MFEEIAKIESFEINEIKLNWYQYFDSLYLLAGFEDFKRIFDITEFSNEASYYNYNEENEDGKSDSESSSTSDEIRSLNGRQKRGFDYENFNSFVNQENVDFDSENFFNITEDEFKLVDRTAAFHFIFVTKKSELGEYINEDRIAETLDFLLNETEYKISVFQKPAADSKLKETLSKFGATFPEKESDDELIENFENLVCKNPSDDVVTDKQCDDRVLLKIFIDDSVDELFQLEKAAFQIVKNFKSSNIDLNFLASGLKFEHLQSENQVLESLYSAKKNIRAAKLKQCDEIIKTFNSSMTTSIRFYDPDLIVKQFFFLIMTQNGFRRLSDCIIGDENIQNRAAHVSQNSEIRLIKTETLFAIVVDSENSKCAETTPLSNQFANVFNVAAENLNYELAFKIEQNICRFKQNNLEKRLKQTCSMKEDLNLIISIDISIQSREYYRSYYTVIIQEIVRAFEFKWDELNLNNERLKSRIQVFGIKKPRRIIQKIKLFDTIDFSTPLENSSAKLENWLNSAELAIMNPQITQSSGMTPKADDVVAFLRKFYEVEKRKVANVKIVHLQNTDLNKIEEKRQRRSTFESDQTDFSRQILIATSDTNFQDFKRSHFLDIINIESVNSTFLGKYFKDVWSTIDQINKFICEKETEIAFSDSSRCYAALDTFGSQRFELINGGKKIGDCCYWKCDNNKITAFLTENQVKGDP
ncbi:unnamed protein product [Oikopleura dioica]|uniref:Uncharacterized protein n=1 Tax=Oikopleura dioica TaxID=34765 RepID=E4YAT3_OIKDI|nr:unnamed protein product [Oikopleura dioica]